MTEAEREATVERIRARGQAARDEKGEEYWHALFHALSGMHKEGNNRVCEFCLLAERGQ